MKLRNRARYMAVLFILLLASSLLSPQALLYASPEPSHRILMDFYHGGWDGYPGYKSISQLLTEEGYIVEKNYDKTLDEVGLSNYDVLLLTYPWNDFSQGELDAIREYVYNGGGLLEVVDTQIYHGRKAPNQVAGLFGVHFYGDMVMSAAIVDFNHPITMDKSRGDLFNPFLLYDAAIDKYPPDAVVLIRAGSTLSNVPNGTSTSNPTVESSPPEDPVAMVALNYGKGRAVFGPLNGLAQPWGKPWYGRNEPNKILLNAVEWLVGKIPPEILDAEAKLYNSSIATLKYMKNQMTDMTVNVITDFGAEIFSMAFKEGIFVLDKVEEFVREEVVTALEPLAKASSTDEAIVIAEFLLERYTMESETQVYNKHAEFINTPIIVSPEANISALVKDILKITEEINATSEVINKIRRAYDLIETSKTYAFWIKVVILVGGGVLIILSGPLGLAAETIATAVLTATQPIGYYELGATATQGLSILFKLHDFHEASRRISTVYTSEVEMTVSSLETGRLLIPSGEIVEIDYQEVVDKPVSNFSAIFKNTGLVSTNARICMYVGFEGPFYSKAVTIEPGKSKLLSISIPFTQTGGFPTPSPYGVFRVQIRVEYGFCYERYTAFQNFTCYKVPMVDVLKQATLIPAGKSETTVTITVTNYKNAPVTVTVIDEIPKSLASTLDKVEFITPYTRVVEPDPKVEWVLSLMPNETRQIKYRISVPVLEVGQFIELPAPTITYLDPLTEEVVHREGPSITVATSDAAVSLNNVTVPRKVFVGDVFPLTASIKNLGEANATSVGITIILPKGLGLVSGKNVTTIGTLTSGQIVNTTWLIKAEHPGNHTVVLFLGSENAGSDIWITPTISTIIPATVDFKPDTINMKSKADENSVTVYIEFPVGYEVNNVDVTTVKLFTAKGNVSVQPSPIEIGDYDNDGIPDLMVKLQRQEVIEIVDASDQVLITIRGEISGNLFEGTDIIKVLNKK